VYRKLAPLSSRQYEQNHLTERSADDGTGKGTALNGHTHAISAGTIPQLKGIVLFLVDDIAEYATMRGVGCLDVRLKHGSSTTENIHYAQSKCSIRMLR